MPVPFKNPGKIKPGNSKDRYPRIVALAGGVGGAKMVDGLARILPPENLTIIVNTGDDFTHFGLYVCPDLDTICYTLAGFANHRTGWGRTGETWQALENAALLGGPGWFRLGDRDLGTHLERTRRLQEGQTLSRITRDFCLTWGVNQAVLPMTNEPVRTKVNTFEFGELSFQEYFVREECRPRSLGFLFDGISNAIPAPGCLEAIRQAEVVVICPSNPWVSIDPVLAVPGLISELMPKNVVAVSPIIGGKAIRGPAAKMFTELGIEPSALSVARHYGNILDGFVIDHDDAELAIEIEGLEIRTLVTRTVMRTRNERRRLAQDVLDFGRRS